MQRPEIFFDLEDIKLICGSAFYQRGSDYWSQGRVLNLRPDDSDPDHWCATVRGTQVYEVDVYCRDGEPPIDGYCTCPAFDDVGNCKHIAAVLVALYAAATGRSSGLPAASPPAPDHRLIRTLLTRLVPKDSPSARQLLKVQYLVQKIRHGHDMAFGIELRIGVERLYVVPKIREFLDHVFATQPHVFTKKFRYDPTLHGLSEADRRIFTLLQEAHHLERAYAGSGGYPPYSYYYRSSDWHRFLYIPPVLWDQLEEPLVAQEAVWADQNALVGQSPEPIAGQFAIETTADDRFALRFSRTDRMDFYPRYRRVVVHNTIHTLPESQIHQWEQLYALPGQGDMVTVPISPEILTETVTDLIPVLETLGTVTVDERLQSRVKKVPLLSHVFLDLEDDVLVGHIEYHYGDTVIRPGAPSALSGDTIVIRDTAQEQHIMNLMHEAEFSGTERLICADPDAMYRFMQDVLPILEDEAAVFLSDRLDPVVPRTWEPHVHADKSASGTDWLAVEFDFGDVTDEDIRAVVASLKERRRYHRLASGRFLSLDDPASEGLRSLLADWDLEPRRIRNQRLEMPLLDAVPLMGQEGQALGLTLGRPLRQWLDTLAHPDNVEAEVPLALKATLRPYQEAGFQWMAMMSTLGLGGILADDMGLGKTLQSIAYLLWHRSRAAWEGPALIVAPASLIYNWAEEIRRFAPSLRTSVAAGSQGERLEVLGNLSEVDILVTSYPLLRRDLDWYQAREFPVVIFDEAQALKNAGTQTAQAALSIKSPHRFALTGTPVENALDDLWSIFRVISPGVLGSRERFLRMTPEQVAKRIKPFVLRRLKSDVLKELPDKIETVQMAALTREQKAVYLNYLGQIQSSTISELSQAGFQKNRMKILAGLTRLRQICCDPALFLDGYRGGSGKLDLLLEVLDEALASHRRILVFSQFTSMLARIRAALEERDWPAFYLDGDTPVADRLALVNRFNAGERSLFLISLKAGGTGLNLTGADTVVLYDLWWNPAVEQQAVDRAHRIGQKNVVQVIRLITQGTVEEKIYALQEKKRDLIDQVVEAGSSEGLSTLTEADVREILSLGTPAPA